MHKLLALLAMVAGVTAAAVGLLVSGGLAVGLALGSSASPASPAQVMQGVTVALAVAVLSLAPGLSLAWLGWSAGAGKPGGRLRLPAWGWWAAATAGVLLLCRALCSGQVSSVLMPPVHLLSGALPSFLFLALAAGAARQAVAARPTLASLIWGGLGGAGVSIAVETVLLMGAAVAMMLLLSQADPDLFQTLQEWALEQLQTGSQAANPGIPGELLASPLAAVGVYLIMSLAVPMIEEGAKSLALPLVGLAGRRMTPLDGFLYGVAAGAGFTAFEGILNGSLSLVDANTWASAMTGRVGTAAIHCLASGFAGLCWQELLSGRRTARAVGWAALALTWHGSWNAVSGGLVLLSFQAQPLPALPAGSQGLPPVTTVLYWLGLAFMVALWLVSVAALPLIARRLSLAGGTAGDLPPG